MALLRPTSNLLRTRLRPVAGVSAPLVCRAQGRNLEHFVRRDDLGGPGGQQPVPENPGGTPDVLKRNWVSIAAGAVAGFAGLKYWSLEKPPRTPESDLKAAMSTEIGYLPQPTPGTKPFDKNKEIQAFSEMSGRKGGGSMGPFRAE